VTVTTSREELGVGTDYVAPRNELETRIARIWSAKLNVGPVGVHDDFFELGGDSLLAAELQLDIDAELGVEVPTWALFVSSTVADLARAIEEDRP
jgi:acyl carrier protein